MTETVHGIEYSHPQVILLQDTGIGTSELAARTCYDSFNASENDMIKLLDSMPLENMKDHYREQAISSINTIEHSDLLDTLAWTHFHHSILEHANLTYLIKGTSRGVLQEHARHRIQGISVRSTRYTMQNILHAFNACALSSKDEAKNDFYFVVSRMDMFVVEGKAERLEIDTLYDKLYHQFKTLGKDQFDNLTMSKEAKEKFKNRHLCECMPDFYACLERTKSKRNVGDAFKWVVTDNWKVDMVVTFNLRSLKNYFQLRDSGSAYFQIQWLAKAMKEVTPSKYLDLIVKAN